MSESFYSENFSILNGCDGRDAIDGVPGLPGKDLNPITCETENNIYVDINKGDDDDFEVGNPQKPCKTLVKAVKKAEKNNKIVISSGFYPAFKVDIDLFFTGNGPKTFIEGMIFSYISTAYVSWAKIGYIKLSTSSTDLSFNKILLFGNKKSLISGKSVIRFTDSLFEENSQIVFTEGVHTLIILNSQIKRSRDFIVVEEDATLTLDITATTYDSNFIKNRGGKIKFKNYKDDDNSSDSCSSSNSFSCKRSCSPVRIYQPTFPIIPPTVPIVNDFRTDQILNTMLFTPPPVLTSSKSFNTQQIETPVIKSEPKSIPEPEPVKKENFIKAKTVDCSVNEIIGIDPEIQLVLVVSDGKKRYGKFGLALPKTDLYDGKTVIIKNTCKQPTRLHGGDNQIHCNKLKDNSMILNAKSNTEFVYFNCKGWIKSK